MTSLAGSNQPPKPWQETMKNIIIAAILVLAIAGNCAAEQDVIIVPVNLGQGARQVIEDQHNRALGTHKEVIDGKEIEVLRVLTEHGHIRHFKINTETNETNPAGENK